MSCHISDMLRSSNRDFPVFDTEIQNGRGSAKEAFQQPRKLLRYRKISIETKK